jgi:hypothetical protein
MIMLVPRVLPDVDRIAAYLEEESRETLRDSSADQLSTGWHYLRWFPSALDEMRVGDFGRVEAGCETSPCFPDDEYYGRGNHPITFWSEQVRSGWCNPQCGLEWTKCDREEAQYLAGPGWDDYASVGAPEQIIRLAEDSGLGDFDDPDAAAAAIIAAGGYWFRMGDPVESDGAAYLAESLHEIVKARLEYLAGHPPPPPHPPARLVGPFTSRWPALNGER